MPKKTQTKVNLTKNLEKLEEIVEWFDSEDNIDIEEALKKVRDGAKLIKAGKARLKQVENEFREIEEELDVNKKA